MRRAPRLRIPILALLSACTSASSPGIGSAVPLEGSGAWVWARTVDQYGAGAVLDALEESGVRHVFLLVKSITGEVRDDQIDALLSGAHARGMYVHAWFACFKDARWTESPVEPGSAAYRAYLLDVIARFLAPRAGGRSIDGVHLDYVRYARDAADRTSAVTTFVAEVRGLIVERGAGRIVLSVASKAEEYTTSTGVAASARYYGQDYADLARYVDLFLPMTYFLDYRVAPAAAMQTAARVAALTNRPVLAGVQLHAGPDGTLPTADDVRTMLQAARAAGLPGVAYFRAEQLIRDPSLRAAARQGGFRTSVRSRRVRPAGAARPASHR